MKLVVPKPGERVAAFGDSGAGKTRLLRALFKSIEHGIAIDTKHDGELTDLGELVVGDAIYDVGPGRFVWRPPDSFVFDEDERERFFSWALDVGRRVIYCDEFGDVVEGTGSYPRALRLAVMRGRSRQLGIWGTAQEPVRVPSFLFGQAQHLYIFHCSHPTHQAMAANMYGAPIPWDTIRYGSYAFLYKGPAGRSGPYRLPPDSVAGKKGDTT